MGKPNILFCCVIQLDVGIGGKDSQSSDIAQLVRDAFKTDTKETLSFAPPLNRRLFGQLDFHVLLPLGDAESITID